LYGPRTDQAVLAEMRRRAVDGKGSRRDLWLRTETGADRLFDLSLTPLRDAAGTIRHWVCIYDDITERREMEEQARRQERLSLLGQMAGGVSHDFNNLLSVILGNVELLEDAPDPETARILRREVVDAVMRGRSLNESLLTFAGRAPLQPDAADLVDFVESLRPLIDRAVPSAVTVEYDLRRPCPKILLDPAMAESCLLNLVINARQAVAASGRITISVAEAEAADLRETAPSAASRHVALRVADTGAGMSEHVQQRAFEPFFTTRATGQGSGLGLSRVRGYVEQMGGFVRIASAEGQGTEVGLFFPVLESESPGLAPISDRPATGTALPAGTRVLLVEDNAMLARVTARHLESFGCIVATASNGDDALERYAVEGPFDALVTDVVMPGIPGDQLAHRLVETDPRLVVIVVTGYRDRLPSREDRHPRIRLLEKPFPKDMLRLTLRQLVGSRLS
jgi:signal transduction histidine kinase/CheY-like chemotaxis protein